MTRRIAAAIVLGIALAQPVAAQTTLNFDDLTGQGPMPLNYGGISWTNDWFFYDGFQPPYTPSSGLTRLGVNGQGTTTTVVETFFDFLTPAQGISAMFAGQTTIASGSDPNFVSLNLYYLGFLVHSSGSILVSSTPQLLDASGYAGLVDRVSVFAARGWVVMDDLSFETQPTSTVPEPATMTLLATGLAGMAAARRRKKA